MTMVSREDVSIPPASVLDDSLPGCWPPRISVLDVDGRTLGEADVLGPPFDGSLTLGEVAAPERLLAYYFGKAGRRLMLDLGDRMVSGWLETCWDGDRRSWWVALGEM
jgi:hypothetical protein